MALVVAAALACGCREDREAGRRESAEATATAEQMASEGTLTGATVEQPESPAEAERARGEIIAAFRLEQADYRLRLQRALDALDKEVAHARQAVADRETRLKELRARRSRLKADLDAVDRCTEQDWATLRTKVDRDLAPGRRP
jgi:hypothetical protein